MSRDVFVRPITGNATNPNVRQALEWLHRIREASHFDTDVLTYPSTALLCAYLKREQLPLLYVPVQKVYMLDGLGPNPMASKVDVAAALAQIIKSLNYNAYSDGIGEIYFPCDDLAVNEFATAHGFDRMQTEMVEGEEKKQVDMPFLKMKVYT